MRSAITKPLFAWDALEDSPSLQSLRVLLESVPDHELLDSLRAARGKGRDDYPVAVLWGTLVLALALRHVAIDASREELRRKPALRLLLGIAEEDQVPGPDNLSRVLATLGEEPQRTHRRRIFDTQVGRLGAVIGDFGTDTAGDSTGLAGRAAVSEKWRAAAIAQGLPPPSGGRTESKDDDGNLTQVVEWFGYKLHFLVAVNHEVARADHIPDTKAGDHERIPDRVRPARNNLPTDRIKTLAYDKAADDRAVHAFLPEEGIAPLIQNRNFKLEEPEKVLGGSTPRNIVYDPAGTVYCYDRVSPEPVRPPWRTSATNPSAAR